MKIFRYSLFVAALLGMAGLMNSCNDDDSGNGAGDATIGFAKSTYTYKESAGLVKLPVAFTGEPKSYPITFNVSAEIAGTDVKLEEVAHFTQLEGLRYVGNEKAPAYIEFELFDNTEINEPRFITLTITSASGAVIENGTTTIEVADNDNNPYEKLWGNWTFTGNSISDGTPQTFDVNISGGFTEEDVAKNADKVLVCWGFAGYKETVTVTPANQPVWYINYDADAGTLSIAVGTMLANIFSFSIDGYSSYELKTASLLMTDEDAPFDEKTQIKGTWSEDLNTLTFDPDYALAATIYGDGTYTKYYWKGYSNIVMTRKTN